MDPRVTFWLTTAIFAVTYAGLALGRFPRLSMDRAGIAFAGAAAMLATGILTVAQATSPDAIDYETIFLLLGMMVVVGFLRLSGALAQLTLVSLSRITSPRGLLLITISLAGMLSAFLVNDIVCLALTPLVLHISRRLKFPPIPHVIGLATAANIGSACTITGNPQNMIIGMQSHISYGHFMLQLLPVSILGLAIDFVVISFLYRTALQQPQGIEQTPGSMAPPEPLDHQPSPDVNHWLRRKSVTVALLTIVLFFTGLPIAVIAIAAAAVLMVGRVRPDQVYQQIDWRLLLMFAGLFIVVHAFQLQVVSRWHIENWHFLLDHPIDLLSVAAAGVSNLVSNVPAVMLFEPVMRTVPPALQEHAWLALAMSSTFAGNLTVLGSVANLIVVESARSEGVKISFAEYCRTGIPVTLMTLALGIAWLCWVHY